MFWGLIMEPNKRYTQTVEKPFHISQAAMDTSTGDNEICQVMVVVDGKNFLVCTLQKNKTIQVPLDLYFKTGNVVSFLTNGKCNVHLTGYLDPEFDEEESDGEEEEEKDEEEEAPELVPAGKNKNKRKLDTSTESATKKLKREAKKVLKQQLDTSQDSDEEEEEVDDDDEEEDADEDSSEEDSTGDLQKLLDGDVDSDDNDESFKPNSTGGGSEEEDSGEDSDELHKSEADTSAASQAAESPAKMSKSQKRRLKRLQQKQQQEQPQQPQTNGVADKKKAKKEQAEAKQKPSKHEGKAAGEGKPASPEKRESKSLSGVQIDDLKVGSGPVAKSGKVVQVYYEGRLKQNNKMFDSCLKGPGFKFRLGSKEVIAGWDVGLSGMKVGGKRKIVCPPAMAYGAKGSPPVIPPNATLVFEVELKNVK